MRYYAALALLTVRKGKEVMSAASEQLHVVSSSEADRTRYSFDGPLLTACRQPVLRNWPGLTIDDGGAIECVSCRALFESNAAQASARASSIIAHNALMQVSEVHTLKSRVAATEDLVSKMALAMRPAEARSE